MIKLDNFICRIWIVWVNIFTDMTHNDRFKAEKITDIKDEAQFIEVLRFLSTSTDNFIIKNGYIYVNSKDEQEGYVLWFVRIDVIQAIYEIYKPTNPPKIIIF